MDACIADIYIWTDGFHCHRPVSQASVSTGSNILTQPYTLFPKTYPAFLQ